MAERLTKTYVPQDLKTCLSIDREWNNTRIPLFLQRNLRSFFAHHAARLASKGPLKSASDPYRDIVKAEDLTGVINAKGARIRGDGKGAVSKVEAVSKDTIFVKTMDPDFEGNLRRSVRRGNRKIFDQDESTLKLAPVSIRKKINFNKNRPEEGDRPSKRYKGDRSITRVKCHCTITLWGDRNGSIPDSPLVETHNNCMVTWHRTEGSEAIADVEMDKPFYIRLAALKVPIEEGGTSTIGMCSAYPMEFKIWPSNKDSPWPPIPVLGKSDGDMYRKNRSAHGVLSKSLIAKYAHLPELPGADSPLSIFYLSEDGLMHRTKYGLELSGSWIPADETISPDSTPINQEWILDDEGNEFGRKKKRPARFSSPVESPRPRKKQILVERPASAQKPKSPQKQKPRPKSQEQSASIDYLWEPAAAQKHLAQDCFHKTTMKSLGCPTCEHFNAHDLWELRMHFLTAHPKLNFILENQEYNDDTGQLLGAEFLVRSTIPSQRRLTTDDRAFTYLAPAGIFDLRAYINGDTSWTGESPIQAKPAPRKRERVPNGVSTSTSARSTSRIPGFVEDPLANARHKNHGHLPAEKVPEFRKPDRRKHRVAALVRHTDENTLSYDSISHRPTYPSEDSMSETDDERDGEWYIQRHLEDLDVDGENYGRSEARKELFRKWDRHRLEEKLDNLTFLSESLVRFARKHRGWLRQEHEDIQISWHRLLENLLEDKLISYEVQDSVHKLIFEDDDAEDDVSDAAGAQLNGEAAQNMANGVADSTVSDNDEHISAAGMIPQDPALAIEAIRARLLRTRPGCCGTCSNPVLPEKQCDALRCTARECPTAEVFYHPACARADTADRRNWACLACRAAVKLGMERAAAKGKGKERAA
jgi:hypothetical protein